MFQRDPKNEHLLSMLGLILIFIAIVIFYGLIALHDAGFVSVVCKFVLRHLFSQLCWLIPVLCGLIGIVLVCDADEPSLVIAMASSGVCCMMLLAVIYKQGFVGRTLAAMIHLFFGAFAETVQYSLVAILTISMLGLSSRRTILHLLIALWELRLPALPPLPKLHFTLKFNRFNPLRHTPRTAEEVDPSCVAIPLSGFVPGKVRVVAEEIVIPPHLSTPNTQRIGLPPLNIFNKPEPQKAETNNREILIAETLRSFGVGVTVRHKEVGPRLTRYELAPDKGTQVKHVSTLREDIALALKAPSLRLETPIPGRDAIGLEIPNEHQTVVTIRELLETTPKDLELPIAIGKDITGKSVFADLQSMPHLLVAGATGAGKSVCLNTIITSLIVSCTPDQIQLLMIDPKRVELPVYDGIPHLIQPVITDAKLAVAALVSVMCEMDNRYTLFAKSQVRKIEEYNEQPHALKLPYIVVIIDELADLMLQAGKKVEEVICRLAQLARATGIHLVVATQRPSVDIITGTIKNNLPSRISFAVSSNADSRIVLDQSGAEHLLGKGDMLFFPTGLLKPLRVQGAMITIAEVKRLVQFWEGKASPENLVQIIPNPSENEPILEIDPLAYQASLYVISQGEASIASLITRFECGHPRAKKLMQSLEDLNVVGPQNGTKPRRVLVDAQELDTIFGKDSKCLA